MRRRDLLRATAAGAGATLVGVASAGTRSNCDRTTTTRVENSVSSGEGNVHEYALRTSEPCEVVASLSADSGTDFDLYCTLDGRTPTRTDYDRRSRSPGSEESISLSGSDLGAVDIEILVYGYDGSGGYVLTVEERGSGTTGAGGAESGNGQVVDDGDGGDQPGTEDSNRPPTAAFSLSGSPLAPGETLTVDAGDSSDPDGALSSYEWTFGDGATATGESASHTYDATGEYTVELAVTDDDGQSVTATAPVVVTDASARTTTTTFSGDLATADARARHTYQLRTDAPRRVTVELNGATDRDFDLYVTTDGRQPALDDFDRRSWGTENGERAVLEGLDADAELGILVDAWRGTGSYEVTVTEENAAVSATCGGVRASTTYAGTLSGTGDAATYSYDPTTSDPCRVVAVLEGPVDVDLFAAAGRTPTRDDHDAAGRSYDGRERVALDPDGSVRLRVDAWHGTGDFQLRVVEFG